MKKGFTLIELLAVIVILAIIAIIATPIILNIINDTRESGRKRSAEAVAHTIETEYLSMIVLNAGNSITIEDIIDRTKINNEASRTTNSITTKDGVTCTISGDDIVGFKITCINTKDNDKEILTKELTLDNNTTSTGFTGTIYRNSGDFLKNGKTIHPWCITANTIGFNSCVYNERLAEVFNTQEECNSMLTTLINYPEYQELASAASCIQYSPLYETDLSEIQEDFYLKNIIVNDIVKASYVCARYGSGDEACLRGGNSSYYGSYDGMNDVEKTSLSGLNPTGNLATLENMRTLFESASGSCIFNVSYGGDDDRIYSKCNASLFEARIVSNGVALISYNNYTCGVGNTETEGISYCAQE